MKGSEHMPYRSNIPCKHPGCAALIPYGQMYCEEHKPLHTKDREDFLKQLQDDCDTIGEGQNLGELKSYVLLQVLNLKFGEQIYVFCSDDKNARNGVISIGGARCISVLSSFVRLKKEISFTKEDAMPYIDSYMNTCLGKDQTAFRVQDTSKERRMCRIPCEQVFEEIFDGKIDELITGNLKYI